MREPAIAEVDPCDGGMSGQCGVEMGLNFLDTAAAIGISIGTSGLAAVGAVAGSVVGWSGWYRTCGPSANYGESRKQQ